jgi:hypothetical protein
VKIILSRKGFDQSLGGVPSPILPDGRLCSLPIPYSGEPRRFQDIAFGATNLGELVKSLTRGRISDHSTAHLDPDLRRAAIPRLRGWRPMFGQGGAAQSHLHEAGVTPGDLFLFFGWFRRVINHGRDFRYDPRADDQHVIFGWLQIDRIYETFPPETFVPKWARYHPHVDDGFRDVTDRSLNTVYVARDRLDLPGVPRTLPGGGVFPKYNSDLRLTRPGETRSVWRLPSWTYPFGTRAHGKPLTHHKDRSQWKKHGKWVLLRTVGRGQEFVLDCDGYPQQGIRTWLARLFTHAS